MRNYRLASKPTKLWSHVISLIRNLSRIQPFLTLQQLQTFVCACIFLQLDYCNALYFGINESLLNKIQSVQNSAVRLLKKKSGQYGLSTHGYIRKCHWLRVRERIMFKLCLLMHKGMHHRNSPVWLQNLISYNVSERTKKLVHSNLRTERGASHGLDPEGGTCFLERWRTKVIQWSSRLR